MARINNSETETGASPAPERAPDISLIDQIGTLTYPRAVANFGEANALAAMREVARIGGHGEFDDAHFMSPLFGGLAMPDPAKIPEPKKEEFASLTPENQEFYFGKALEEWEKNKQRAIGDREKINAYYSSLK
jgi:hypothetical protein